MNARNLGRFVSSILMLLVIAVVVPAGLIAASRARFGSGNPLAGTRPPWQWSTSDIGDTVSGPLADATVTDVIVRASLCIVWIAVAVIVVTTIGEVVHAVRHRGLPLPDLRGLGLAQRVARFIAVGLITVVPLATPATSLASTLEARPVAADTSPSTPSPASDAVSAAAASTQRMHDGIPDERDHRVAAPRRALRRRTRQRRTRTSPVLASRSTRSRSIWRAPMPHGSPRSPMRSSMPTWSVRCPVVNASRTPPTSNPAGPC